MRLDATLQLCNNQSLFRPGAGVSAPSTGTIDLAGVGVGVAPPNIIGNATVFGQDLGVGSGVMIPQLLVIVGTTFTTGNAATLNVQFQGAVDQGSGGNYQPGTWNTFAKTGTIAAANLTSGRFIAKLDWPPAFPPGTLPRFIRLNFVVPTATNFSAGTISYAGVTSAREEYTVKFAASGYSVAS